MDYPHFDFESHVSMRGETLALTVPVADSPAKFAFVGRCACGTRTEVLPHVGRAIIRPHEWGGYETMTMNWWKRDGSTRYERYATQEEAMAAVLKWARRKYRESLQKRSYASQTPSVKGAA